MAVRDLPGGAGGTVTDARVSASAGGVGRSVRRIIVFTLLFALVAISATGVGDLLGRLLDSGRLLAGGDVAGLALSLAFALIAGPLAALLWWFTWRGMRERVERESLSWMTEKYDVKNIPVEEVTTVARVMALAAGQLQTEDTEVEPVFNLKKWNRKIKREKAMTAAGSTVGEVFLNACEKYGSRMAMADDRMGPVDYKNLKLRTIILANEIRK